MMNRNATSCPSLMSSQPFQTRAFPRRNTRRESRGRSSYRAHLCEIAGGDRFNVRVEGAVPIAALVFERKDGLVTPENVRQERVAPITVNPEERRPGAGRLNGHEVRQRLVLKALRDAVVLSLTAFCGHL